MISSNEVSVEGPVFRADPFQVLLRCRPRREWVPAYRTAGFFAIIPTVTELGLVFVILWHTLDAAVALTTVAVVVLFIAYTMTVTEWRLKFRREMNREDGRASTKAIDSLLNFETVKYFGNEAR